jgi:hypothetical protein
MMRYLAGFEPARLTGSTLQLRPGSAASRTGSEVISKFGATDIDINVVGVNGRDVAAAPTNGSDWHVYLIKNTTTGDLAAVLSQSITYGGVALPAGYENYRKLPFGLVWQSSLGGFPQFHVAHWPSPLITFTQFESNGKFAALSNGAATAWTAFNVTGFLPDNARLAWLEAQITGNGTAGSAYITESPGSEPMGVFLGSANPASFKHFLTRLPHRVTSTRQLFYRVTGGATLTVRVLGFSMTEPS